MHPLPSPFERLAGCLWLPRILEKARRLEAGELPEEYAKRFCAVTGVDAEFLKWFELGRDDILALARLPEAEAARRFAALPGCGRERIEAWNRAAPNFGKPGYPMAERFPIAMQLAYKEHVGKGIDNVFDVIVEDERAQRG